MIIVTVYCDIKHGQNYVDLIIAKYELTFL